MRVFRTYLFYSNYFQPLTYSLAYMPEPLTSKSLENRIITSMDLTTRAPINEQNCKGLIVQLKQTDTSYLQFFVSVADRYFDTAFNFWGKYQYKLGSHISQFMNLLYSKIFYAKAQSLKPAFQRLNNKYQRFTKKRVTLLPEAQVQLYDTDQKFKQYVLQLDQRKTEEQQNDKVLYRQQADKPVDIVINVNKDLGANHLQSRISAFKQMYYKARLRYTTPAQRDVQAKLVEKLEERSVYLRDCFNCLSSVYDKEDLTFPLCKQPATFLGRISQINSLRKEILQQVVSYLNGKGGIILIGTQKDDHSIVPYYQPIAQYSKESYQSKLQSYFATITPAITLNKQVQLCFIPIAENVRSRPDSLKPVLEKQGAYILRITVTPTEPHVAYYYTSELSLADKNDNGTIVFSRSTELGNQELQNQEIYDFMKQRYNEYNPSDRPADSVLRSRGNYHPCLFRHIGICITAEKGRLYFGDIDRYAKEKAKQQKFVNPLLVGLQNFKLISLLVVISSLREQISRIFSDQQKLQNKIVNAFQKQGFKLSNNTFLIFHNCKFQKLKTGIIKNKAALKLKNDKKEVLLISTLPIVAYKVEQCSKSLQQQIQNRVLNVTKEKPTIQTVDEGVYFKCSSIITAVYIYFYVHHYHGIKGYFQKLPHGSNSKSKINKKTFNGPKNPNEKAQTNAEHRPREAYGQSHDDRYEEYEEYQDDYDNEESRNENYSKSKFNSGGSKYKEKQNGSNSHYKDMPQEQAYYPEHKQEYQYQGNYNQEASPPLTPIQTTPIVIYTYLDEVNHIYYYYYNNSLVYMYNAFGQCLGYQPYDMSQLRL